MAGKVVWRYLAVAALMGMRGSLVVTAFAKASPAGAAATSPKAARTTLGSLLTTLSDPLKNGADDFGITVAVSG
jgi:hypothetical protein